MAELGERMTAHEFELHRAYWRREPGGPEGMLQMWAALMAAIANGPLDRRDKRQWRAADFFNRAELWPKPEPAPAPGAKRQRLAPDFSHLRGLKVGRRR